MKDPYTKKRCEPLPLAKVQRRFETVSPADPSVSSVVAVREGWKNDDTVAEYAAPTTPAALRKPPSAPRGSSQKITAALPAIPRELPTIAPLAREISVVDRVPRLSAHHRRMRMVWGVINLALIMLTVAGIGAGVAAGIFAVQHGYNAWVDSRAVEVSHTQPDIGLPAASDCVPPGALPPPVSHGLVRPRQNSTPLLTAPGTACASRGTLDAQILLVPMSGPVWAEGKPWILIQVYDGAGVLPKPVKGWLPEADLVAAE